MDPLQEASPGDAERQADACQELLAYLHDDLRPQIGVPEPQPPHWGVLLALFASASTTYEASVHLARGGFGYQAAMLNRSLFEGMVDAHWVVMNPRLALERIRDHAVYMARVTARTSAKYPRRFGDLAKPAPLSAAEEKPLRKLFNCGTGSWTRLSLKERVEEISPLWPEGMGREHLFFVFDIANSINNYVLHTTPWAMSRTTRQAAAPDGSAVVRFNAGKGAEFRSEARFGSFWIASALVRLMMGECDLDVEGFEDGLYARGIRAFVSIRPEELSKVGRDDPCLCGSDLKFKRCHGR